MKQRFEYSEDSTAGFVELAPSCVVSKTQIFTELKSAPDVERVEWKETKTSQGNVGDHFMEQNIDVWVLGSARPIEFELTRNLHMKNLIGRPSTVSACFKNQSTELHGEAWRILLHAVQGRELLPTHVQDYAKRAMARVASKPPDKDDVSPSKKSRTEGARRCQLRGASKHTCGASVAGSGRERRAGGAGVAAGATCQEEPHKGTR